MSTENVGANARRAHARIKLTDSKIRGLKPEDKRYRINDGDGLYLEVLPTGTKVWRYRFVWHGRATMQGLGEYPAVSLSAARIKRDEARKTLKSGANPITHAKKSRAATFRAVAEELLDWQRKTLTPKVMQAREGFLRRDIYPAFGDVPVADVTDDDVRALIERVEKERPATARFIQQIVGAVCRHAIKNNRRKDDPTQALRGALAPRVVHHHPVMADHDIRKFFEGLTTSQAYPQFLKAAEVLWLTVVRSCELIGADWSEFDLEHGVWMLPAERMKMRQPHVVPLVPRAVELLQDLKVLANGSRFVLPNRNDRNKPAGAGTLSRLWLNVTGGEYSPHGVRGNFSTWAHDCGFDTIVIEAQLAHKDRNESRRSYNRAAYLEQRRELLEAWVAHLDAIRSGAKVIPFQRRRA